MKWPGMFLIALAAGSASAAELQIIVDDIESEAGDIRLALYNDPKTFRKGEMSLKRLSQPAQPGSVTFRVDDLPAGTYAVIVYHDEDGNGKMNRFLGMIPTEGYGLSENPEISGPPAFADADFELGPEGRTIDIKLRY